MDSKTCTQCKELKLLSDFYKEGKYYRSECKKCKSKSNKIRNIQYASSPLVYKKPKDKQKLISFYNAKLWYYFNIKNRR